MTALDQAFIKAYMHQGSVPRRAVPTPEPQTAPADIPADLASVNVPAEPSAAPVETDQPDASSPRPPVRPRAARRTAKPRKPAARRRTKPSTSQTLKIADVPPPDELDAPQNEPPVEELSQEAAPADPSPAPEAFRVRVYPEFHPALQVDHFLWPSGCVRLASSAPDEVDRLSEGIALRGTVARGAVGVCGCCRGEGCTTLLLCAARCLASQGRRVIVVDADFTQPTLTRRLGLLPEVGWEDVLWHGLPLTEAVIESLEDRFAVLPLRGTASKEPDAGASADPASAIQLLLQEYELVLVDLGQFEFASPKAVAVLQTARRWIGSVVIVHNVRATAHDDVDQFRRRLRESGLAEAGIAENFA